MHSVYVHMPVQTCAHAHVWTHTVQTWMQVQTHKELKSVGFIKSNYNSN